jgi:hypothetical protein
MPSLGSDINNYPLNVADIGFSDLTNGNFQLSNSSPYRMTATDGSDPGVDMAKLNQRTACSVSGLTASCLAPANIAETSLSGRVTNLATRGVSKVKVTLTDQNGEKRLSLTNPFGYYKFENVPVGEYSISIAGRRFFGSKNTWVLQETDNVINFVVIN